MQTIGRPCRARRTHFVPLTRTYRAVATDFRQQVGPPGLIVRSIFRLYSLRQRDVEAELRLRQPFQAQARLGQGFGRGGTTCQEPAVSAMAASNEAWRRSNRLA